MSPVLKLYAGSSHLSTPCTPKGCSPSSRLSSTSTSTCRVVDLETPSHSVFYMPMHALRKDSSSTMEVRAVFDASAKTSTGVSLNDILLAPLVDVLLHFRFHWMSAGCIVQFLSHPWIETFIASSGGTPPVNPSRIFA